MTVGDNPANDVLEEAVAVRVAGHAAALSEQYGAVPIALDAGGLGSGTVDSIVEL